MDGFAQRLLDTARQRDISRHPFFQRMAAGAYPRDALPAYARRLVDLTEGFVLRLRRLLALCPERAVCVHLLENLCEEEGMVAVAGGRRLACDPRRRHPELARRFARALGIADEDLIWSPSRMGHNWADRAIDEGDWLSALAYITVGMEANVPPAFRLLLPALQDVYGFAEEEVFFFRLHITADEGHGAAGAELVALSARTARQREQVLAAVSKGAFSWWAFHRVVDRNMRGCVATA